MPDRYQTQVRLGRDADVDEWLATDSALDRPVLIRALDPVADRERGLQFAAAVRAAATVNHMHLARVYEVNQNGTTYAVLEWNGGVSIADRLRAGDTLPVNEFLPNAAGLADGLAAMHGAGVVHGAIDPGAIHFSAAHPAKLSAFGRPQAPTSPEDDTRALATSLRQALTGSATAQLRPSQVVEGLPRSVDDALLGAEAGTLSAAQLAAALRSAPFRPETPTDGGWSWRWLIPASVLLVAALVIAAVGLSIDVDPDSPFLFPATPQEVLVGGVEPTPGETPATTAVAGAELAVEATSYDPFGDNGTEREADVPLLHDGDRATAWRTERYLSPLDTIKPGVGVVFRPEGPAASLQILGSEGTSYEVRWADGPSAELDGWEVVGSGSLVGGRAVLQLPLRESGVWLVWLTSLPQQAPGEWYSEISEVTFRP